MANGQKQDGSIVTAEIADGAVTTPKIANGAVTTGKIADGSLVNADMASMNAGTIKGRQTGGAAGAPEDLTGAQVAAIVAGLVTSLGTLTTGIKHTAVVQTLAAATVTIDLDAGNIQRVVMDRNLTTINITRGTPGKTVVVHFVGSYTATGWTTVDKWIPAGAPTFSGADNYVTLTFDGTTLAGQHGVAG